MTADQQVDDRSTRSPIEIQPTEGMLDVRQIGRPGPTLVTVIRDGPRRIRRRWRGAVNRALRFTAASVSAYVVADVLLSSDTVPVIAALTALLVVEATLLDVVTAGLQRVVSVIAGVLLATGFSALVGISWWSLGVLVAVSIVVGQLLRLGPQLVEVPISAMLVLAVGGHEVVATDRVVETLIGAAVGVAVNVVFPPKIREATAAATVGAFADEIAELLQDAAVRASDQVSPDQAERWLRAARRLSRHVPRMDRALAQAEQSRRLNPRALAHRDTTAVLRTGLEALEHSSVAIRSMFRSIADGVLEDPGPVDEIGNAVRQAFATLLGELADAVRCYGNLVRSEVSESVEPAEQAALTALQALNDARARVVELRLSDPSGTGRRGVDEAVLEAVDRVLVELDVTEHARRRRQLDRVFFRAHPHALFRAVQQGLRAGADEIGHTQRAAADPPAGHRRDRPTGS